VTWLNHNSGAIQALATLVLVLITAGYALVTHRSLREAHRTYSAYVYSSLAEGSRQMQQMLFESPELRPYFYEGLEPPEDAITRGRLLSLSEMFADHVEDIAINSQVLEEYRLQNWVQSMADFFWSSPVLQEFLEDNAHYYGPMYELFDEYGIDLPPAGRRTGQ
jgi:hypothetical protein